MSPNREHAPVSLAGSNTIKGTWRSWTDANTCTHCHQVYSTFALHGSVVTIDSEDELLLWFVFVSL